VKQIQKFERNTLQSLRVSKIAVLLRFRQLQDSGSHFTMKIQAWEWDPGAKDNKNVTDNSTETGKKYLFIL
jgi:hypothetical protein